MRCVVTGDKPLTEQALVVLEAALNNISRIYFEIEFLISGCESFRAAAAAICLELCGDSYYQNYRIVSESGVTGPHSAVLPDAYMIKPEYIDHWRDRLLFADADYAVIYASSRTPAMSEWLDSHSDKFYTLI